MQRITASDAGKLQTHGRCSMAIDSDYYSLCTSDSRSTRDIIYKDSTNGSPVSATRYCPLILQQATQQCMLHVMHSRYVYLRLALESSRSNCQPCMLHNRTVSGATSGLCRINQHRTALYNQCAVTMQDGIINISRKLVRATGMSLFTSCTALPSCCHAHSDCITVHFRLLHPSQQQ